VTDVVVQLHDLSVHLIFIRLHFLSALLQFFIHLSLLLFKLLLTGIERFIAFEDFLNVRVLVTVMLLDADEEVFILFYGLLLLLNARSFLPEHLVPELLLLNLLVFLVDLFVEALNLVVALPHLLLIAVEVRCETDNLLLNFRVLVSQ